MVGQIRRMELIELRTEHFSAYMQEMQEAFQKGYEERVGASEGVILPFDDILQSLNAPHAVAYEVLEGEERMGGAIVAFSDDGEHGDLHFLYTKVGKQNRGVASFAWRNIEERHPNVKVWETHTPYFDTRNIHFYINRCGFHAVEFFNSHHPDPNDFDQREVNPMGGDGFFRFEKKISENVSSY